MLFQLVRRLTLIAFAVVLVASSSTYAQRGGGARNWMGGTRLLRIEMIQKELELDEDQVKEIDDLVNGRRKNEEKKEDETEEKEERPNFRDMSDEQRRAYFDKRRKASDDRRSAEEEAIEEILLPHQVRRLEQVKVQLMGTQALADADIQKKVGLDEKTQERIKKISEERMQEMRDVMRDVFRGGDREEIQETMAEMRESIESAVFDAMTETQLNKFKELKGPKLSFTREEMMGEMFRGFGRGRGNRDSEDEGGDGRRNRRRDRDEE